MLPGPAGAATVLVVRVGAMTVPSAVPAKADVLWSGRGKKQKENSRRKPIRGKSFKGSMG